MSQNGKAPTRAAVLELMNEQVVVKEAYVFLDEKRLLLAAELLHQLKQYRQLEDEIQELHHQANRALQIALEHHGLNGLQVYPPAYAQAPALQQDMSNFMGVMLAETLLLEATESSGRAPPSNPSAAAQDCAVLFSQMLSKQAVLAGISGNLYRLMKEYKLTERRARALENVILPEIDQTLRDMTAHLEELDLEDAIRVRFQSEVA